MAKATATLRFTRNQAPEGFSASSISEHGNKDAYAAIRELIQNALDAAVERKIEPAIIRFSFGKVPLEDVPGIKEYRKALELAEKFLEASGDFDGPNRKILESIKSELDTEYLPVLFVEDNGVGLDSNRMLRLLGDGVSNKKTGNSGSYGVGHYTAFGLTNLRYVLYGGITESDEKIASGHAILASHQAGKNEARGKDGYLVTDDIRNDLFEPYTFASDNEIPALLDDRLEKIKNRWGAGSCIAILGFNFFGDDQDKALEQIENVSVQNFFAAIHSGTLAIQIADETDDTEATIKASDLNRVAKRWHKQAYAKSKGFPSGRAAAESINTLLNGKRAVIENGVRIYWRERVDYRTKITICRNGMWITDSYRKISNPADYGNKVLFDALVLLGNSPAAKTVRDSEPPLHNAIEPSRLDPQGKKDLSEFFKEVQKFFKDRVSSCENESFEADDYICTPVGTLIGDSIKKANRGKGNSVPETEIGGFASATGLQRGGAAPTSTMALRPTIPRRKNFASSQISLHGPFPIANPTCIHCKLSLRQEPCPKDPECIFLQTRAPTIPARVF